MSIIPVSDHPLPFPSCTGFSSRCSAGPLEPHADHRLPRYRYVLLSEDGESWNASTGSLEGLEAFAVQVARKCSAGIVDMGPAYGEELVP